MFRGCKQIGNMKYNVINNTSCPQCHCRRSLTVRCHPPTADPQPRALRQVSREHHRLCGHAQLLHGHDAAEHAGPPFRQHRDTGVLLHHPDPQVVQADQTLARAENTHTHVQGVRQGADAARILPGLGHRRVCQPGVLRRTVAGIIMLYRSLYEATGGGARVGKRSEKWKGGGGNVAEKWRTKCART